MCSRNNSSIVAACDIDRNELAGAISGGDADAVRVGDAFNKLIMRSVGGVDPRSIGIDTEFAIAMTAFDSSLNDEGIGAIHIGRR